MSKSRPYQPLIFRLLHAIHGCLVLGSIATGFWLYNTWDHRWGRLPLPDAENQWLNIHHQIGGFLSPWVVIFLIYSLSAGRRRLIQLKSFKQLTQLKKPTGQYALHRLINSGLLGMLILAMVSARQFGGAKVLLQQEWNVWYNLHVFAWASISLLFIAHILSSLKVGGIPLLQSIIHPYIQQKDSPTQWPKRFSAWCRQILN